MPQKPLFVSDPAKRKMLVASARLGLPEKMMAQKARVAVSTYSRWKKQAAEGDIDYVDFFEEINEAYAEFVSDMLASIQEAARNKSWQAGAWLLERRFPNEFAQRRPDAQYDEGDLRMLMEVITAELGVDAQQQARILTTFNERRSAILAEEREAKTRTRSRKRRA